LQNNKRKRWLQQLVFILFYFILLFVRISDSFKRITNERKEGRKERHVCRQKKKQKKNLPHQARDWERESVHRIESNRIESNRIESNRIESNRIEREREIRARPVFKKKQARRNLK
jgi:flagellar biosynthesis/type III secretory pathway M-ring protein FliF/YscJ